jgi:hypothetical protein
MQGGFGNMLAAVFVGFAHINDGCLSGLNELCCFLWGDGGRTGCIANGGSSGHGGHMLV